MALEVRQQADMNGKNSGVSAKKGRVREESSLEEKEGMNHFER